MSKKKRPSILPISFKRRPHVEILERRRLLSASGGNEPIPLATVHQYGMALFGQDWPSDLGVGAAEIQQHLIDDTWRSMLNESTATTIANIREEAQYLGAEILQAQVSQALSDANLRSVDIRELDWLQDQLQGPGEDSDYFSDGESSGDPASEGELDDPPLAIMRSLQYEAYEGDPIIPAVNGLIGVVVGFQGELPEGGFTVPWTAVPDPMATFQATPGVDFVATSGSVTFSDSSEGDKTIAFAIINDSQDEPDEGFEVELNAPVVPGFGASRVTILENDLHVAIADADPVTEGDIPFEWPDPPMARFQVTISSPRSEDVSIPWRIAPVDPTLQPATPGGDFIRPTTNNPEIDGYLVIEEGQTEGFIEIPIIGDQLYELTEYFNVDIATAYLHHILYTVDDERGLGTINDNDPFPELSVDDVSVEEDAGIATLTVTMTNRSSFPVTFDWTVTDQTAIRPDDYDRGEISGTVTVPAGGAPDPHLEQFVFTIVNDILTEPDETFQLTISNAVQATITKANGVVTILANDPTVDLDIQNFAGQDLNEVDEDDPGAYIRLNTDDDNGNGIRDLDDSGFDDDDLVRLSIIPNFPPGIANLDGFLTVNYDATIVTVWHERNKSQPAGYDSARVLWNTEIDIFAGAADFELWVEGRALDSTIISLTWHRPNGHDDFDEELHDAVRVNVVKLDLDIDSDNNNGFEWPDNSDWEEFLEDNPYGLGKLVMQNFGIPEPAQHFTPMRLRLAPGLNPDDPNLRVRMDFEETSDAGQIALWTTTMNNPARSGNDAANGGHLLSDGTLYTLSQLQYNPVSGGITVYIAGMNENPAIKTMRGVEINHKPQEFVDATLVQIAGGGSGDILSDRVKYIVSQENSFFYALQFDIRVVQGLSASLIYDRIDSLDFCMELMDDQDLVDSGVADPNIRQMLTERDEVSGFNAGLYRHYLGSPTFEYIAAFAGTEPEFPDFLTDALQGVGMPTAQYRNAMDIGDYFARVVPQIQLRLTNTGHSLGGGLASAAYVGGGARTVTFNSAGLHINQVFDLSSSTPVLPIEVIPGSLNRYLNPTVVDAYFVDNSDILSFMQDHIPIVPSAMGNRFPLTGPFHVDPFLTGILITLIQSLDPILGPGIAPLVSAIMAYQGISEMVGSHFRTSYLYGILVTEDANGNITQDLLGYSGVPGSGY